jgi:hypothetical protein
MINPLNLIRHDLINYLIIVNKDPQAYFESLFSVVCSF